MRYLLRLYDETLDSNRQILKRRRRIIDEFFALPEKVKWDTARECLHQLLNRADVPAFEVITLYFGDETLDGWTIDVWCQISLRATPFEAIDCYWMGRLTRDEIKAATSF
jgi:hypothetical protein